MTFEPAIRATEILLALALLQQTAEHLFGTRGTTLLFAPRAALSVALLLGVQSPFILLALSLHSLAVLHRFQGPYNGGSDRMGLLILYCITAAHWLPSGLPAQAAFGYLGAQVILSYVISGQVKLMNPAWRDGTALRDVFAFSAYPVAENLRSLKDQSRLLLLASWAVIAFEILFPLSLLSYPLLIAALLIAIAFHTANACLFGLNRFLWCWIAAYPSILWLHTRLVSGL